MSSNTLPTGPFIILNYAHDQPVGHPPTYPTRQPIILTPNRQVWEIRQIEGGSYALTVNNFVVVSEDDFVWSYLDAEIPPPPTEYLVTLREEPNLFTITDPKSGGRAWTVKEGYTQVSLELEDATKIDPTQLWEFIPVLPKAGKSQKI